MVGLVIWTIIVGDDKQLPAPATPAAPGPETVNTEPTPTEDGVPPDGGTTEETPAPPPKETPAETPPTEKTTDEPTEVTPPAEEVKQG